ncbi:hypothetical protein PWY87_20505 [Kribbella solani]|uniref:hypothetical protein n=1 Tax=Kribbella solani TaxID=236067 RepID=UPI0029AE5D1E|nr:hypothetical protein [Kribbella solani]MDX2971361.1 hypothetical protein [Kribbella solani]MDX3004083.1 hypothetical protein [Kribbella solani]
MAAGVAAELSPGTSVWNGQVLSQNIGDGGADEWGRISLSKKRVIEPLERLFADGPAALDDTQFAATCWSAVATIGHEFEHLYGPEDSTLGTWRMDLMRNEVDAIEEAFTEASAQHRTPRLIDYALPSSLARRLHEVRTEHPELCPPAYRGYVDAANAFVAEVNQRMGVPVGAVFDAAARQFPSGKGPALAALVASGPRIARLAPSEQAAVKNQISAIVVEGFAGMEDLWDTPGPEASSRGVQMATEVIRAAEVRSGDDPRSAMQMLTGLAPAADAPLAPRPNAAEAYRASASDPRGHEGRGA